MDRGDAAAIRPMIEDLDTKIETARHLALDFVAQLLEMARLELLTHYHGIEKGEFDAFCDAIGGLSVKRRRRAVGVGTARPRRPRGERAKSRATRRSGAPGS